MAEQTFDYIVIGAGSAGCPIAHRLSAKADLKVALLEAGVPDQKPEIHEPRDVMKLWGSEVDWGYRTEPVPGLNGRQIPIARGKVLGGCSSIFAMIHVRGNRRDFDAWNFAGCDGWSYDEVLPYFKRLEDWDGPSREWMGKGGPVSIRMNPAATPVAHAFANSGPELGLKGPDHDHNGPQQEDGTGLYQHTITREGKRASTAVAYLKPILGRPNLSVQTGVHVTRVLFEGRRAVGVEVRKGNATERILATREVIVSAGSFDSPKLLMLSGIGPADQLKKNGVQVLSDLPGVGQNLQDHVLLPVFFRSKRELPPPMFIAEAGLFVRTRPGMKAASPDLQFHFSAGIPAFTPPGLGANFAFVPILAKPQSRGTVTLRSANPLDPPVIQPNYMGCEADVQTLRQGIEWARRIARTRAFAEFTDAEFVPGEKASESDIRNFILGYCSTVWHVSGTCKMGRDRMAVVDPQLRVVGVEGLRVADASVMPSITAGNTNAACMMIGEKASDLILGATGK